MIKYEIGDIIKFRSLVGPTTTCKVINKFRKHKTLSFNPQEEACFEGRIIDSSEIIDNEICFGWDSEIISINGEKVITNYV
tara:strand:- start:60 stop:302 length:243 start_codon:yes stop_codon:yes gene_type:complete